RGGVAVRRGFANPGDAPGADHAAGAGVIGGEGLLQVAVEAVELFAQVARAAFEVGEGVVRVHAQFARGPGHQLGEAARARGRYGRGAPAALLPYDRLEQRRAEIVPRRELGDLGGVGGGDGIGVAPGVGDRGLGYDRRLGRT